MSDKELIFQAANTFTKNLVSNLFGINTIGTDALITYVVNNMEDKYGMYLEPFLDKGGNLNIDLFGNALRDVMKTRAKMVMSLSYLGNQSSLERLTLMSSREYLKR